jgi:hypothetical protein
MFRERGSMLCIAYLSSLKAYRALKLFSGNIQALIVFRGNSQWAITIFLEKGGFFDHPSYHSRLKETKDV